MSSFTIAMVVIALVFLLYLVFFVWVADIWPRFPKKEKESDEYFFIRQNTRRNGEIFYTVHQESKSERWTQQLPFSYETEESARKYLDERTGKQVIKTINIKYP